MNPSALSALQTGHSQSAQCPHANSPISNIPTELFQEIFTFSIPQITERLHKVSGLTHPLDSGEPHPDIVRASIGGVSRYWREVLNSTPAAWTALVLDQPQQNRNHYLLWLTKCLDLSGDQLLEIFLSSGSSINPDYRRDLMSLLRPHFQRTQKLFCAIESSYIAQVLFTSDDDTSETLFPRLGQFGIVGLGVFTGVRHRIHIPSLVVLSVSSWFSPLFRQLSVDTLESIRSLRLSYSHGPMRADLQELARCRNLQDLTLVNDRAATSSLWETFGGERPLQLSSLRFLRLAVCAVRTAIQFTSLLWAPELEYFSLRVTQSPRDYRPKVADFICSLSDRFNQTEASYASTRFYIHGWNHCLAIRKPSASGETIL